MRGDDFTTEKEVILEEIGMYEDMPGFAASDKARRIYFGEHPLGQSILGTKESIAALSRDAMQARNVTNPYPQDAKDSAATRRRTVYMFHKRVVQYPLMQAFDAPDAQASCGRRENTTVAPQALALLNDRFVRQHLRADGRRSSLRSQ